MGDVEPEDIRSEPAEPESAGRDRSWMWLAAAVVVVVTVAVLTTVAATNDGDGSTATHRTAFTDGFSADGSPLSGGGPSWQPVRGAWFASDGEAIALPDDLGHALVVTGPVKLGAVRVHIAGKGRCGVVVRYEGPGTYVAFERIPKFGVWNLVRVEGGTETVLAKVDDTPGALIEVEVTTGERVIAARAGDKAVSVVEPSQLSAAPVGLVFRAGDTGCRWDDFWAGNAR